GGFRQHGPEAHRTDLVSGLVRLQAAYLAIFSEIGAQIHAKDTYMLLPLKEPTFLLSKEPTNQRHILPAIHRVTDTRQLMSVTLFSDIVTSTGFGGTDMR
ncbi:hypothetical protein MTO96_025175, partial [Rhipicephalus appendiculatus]